MRRWSSLAPGWMIPMRPPGATKSQARVVAGLLLFAIIGLAEARTAYIMVPPVVVFTAALFAASSQLIRPPLLGLATLALLAVAILNIAEVALHRVVWV